MDNYESRPLLPMPFPKLLKELTDECLMELIDRGHYDSISQLEKVIGAGKNQLCNRYSKVKKKLIQERRCKAMEIVRPIVQECFIPAQYTSSPEIIKNCLQEVLSEGMMYSQVSAPADNEAMTKKQRVNIHTNSTAQKNRENIEFISVFSTFIILLVARLERRTATRKPA